MILFYSDRRAYAEVFTHSLSVFLSETVEALSFDKDLSTDEPSAQIVIIDGHELHPQRLARVLKNHPSSVVVLMSDGVYQNSRITMQVTSHAPAYEVSRLCQYVLQSSDAENKVMFNPKEERLLISLQQGQSNRQIARHHGLTLSTVKYHLRNIYDKLGVDNRTQAALKLNKITL